MKTGRNQNSGKRPRIKKVMPIIKESVEDQLPQNSGAMEDQKTYEDYNKEQPLPINPAKQNNQKQVDNSKKK